jgi:hypothetical protein
VTPRGTDWTLAVLVAAMAVTGALTLFGGPVVFAVHDVAGLALGGVLVWKLRRVARRAFAHRLGPLAAVLVLGTLVTGVLWSSAVHPRAFGYNPLNLHGVLGTGLVAAVAAHMLARAKPPRGRDLTRRQLLTSAGVTLAALLAWQAQRTPGLASAKRRWTGSYDTGADFPATSWVADDPRPIRDYRLETPVGTLTRLDAADELTATLDCTGGFYTTQRWRGIRLDRLLGDAPGSHVRVISVTGYRWSFDREQASELLLATHVNGRPLTHGHGAPARLVAPGHRGFVWVKWVTRVELHDGPDAGAFLSTLTSSFTPRS